MAVLPISAVKVDSRNNGLNFTGIRKNKYSSEINNDSARSNDLAKVPVVLMIAMSPSMMNAKTPVQIMPLDEGNMTEMYEQAPVETNDATYVARPEEFQQSDPLGVTFFRHRKIKQIKSAIAGGHKANLVMTSYNRNDNTVSKVYLVRNDYKNSIETQEPPYIKELIYHDLGPTKEFLGVKVVEKVYDKNTQQYKGTIGYELKLDDTSAQYLLDFNAGSTKWVDETGIKFRETTNPNVAPVKQY